MLFGHKYCSLNVKKLLIYKRYKNKESHNKSKIPMHNLPLGWNFKWLKKLTGKIAISIVYDIQPADMKVWWTTSLLSIITTLQKIQIK